MAADGNQLIGTIMLFAGNFVPRSWAYCDGQLLTISQHNALLSLLGTTYGGDGRSTFALPDLRGRVPLGPRTGPGLSTYLLGERGGQETHVVTVNELASHFHQAIATATRTPGGTTVPINATATMHASNSGTTNNPAGKFPGKPADISLTEVDLYGSVADVTMNAGAVTIDGTVGATSIPAPIVSVTLQDTGGTQAHNNIQPFEAINYIIALEGIYPSRN